MAEECKRGAVCSNTSTNVYLPPSSYGPTVREWAAPPVPSALGLRVRFVSRTRAVGPLTAGIGATGVYAPGGGYATCPCGCRRGSRE